MVERRNAAKDDSDSSDDDAPVPQMQGQGHRFFPLTKDKLAAYSRYLHNKVPPNLYFRVKIPWKTIFIAFVFLVVGTVFLCWGLSEFLELGIQESYEKFLLGFILFIPGSYHTFIAAMALLGRPGYDYQNLTTFESENFFDDD